MSPTAGSGRQPQAPALDLPAQPAGDDETPLAARVEAAGAEGEARLEELLRIIEGLVGAAREEANARAEALAGERSRATDAEARIRAVEGQLAGERSRATDAEARIRAVEGQLAGARGRADELARDLAEVRRELEEARRGLEKAESEKRRVLGDLDEARRAHEETRKELCAAEEARGALQALADELKASVTELGCELDSAVGRAARLEEQLQGARIEAEELAEARAQTTAAVEMAASATKRQREMEIELHDARLQLEVVTELRAERDRLRKRCSKLEGKLHAIAEELQRLDHRSSWPMALDDAAGSRALGIRSTRRTEPYGEAETESDRPVASVPDELIEAEAMPSDSAPVTTLPPPPSSSQSRSGRRDRATRPDRPVVLEDSDPEIIIIAQDDGAELDLGLIEAADATPPPPPETRAPAPESRKISLDEAPPASGSNAREAPVSRRGLPGFGAASYVEPSAGRYQITADTGVERLATGGRKRRARKRKAR